MEECFQILEDVIVRLQIQVEDAADVVFHVNTLDLLLYVLSKI